MSRWTETERRLDRLEDQLREIREILGTHLQGEFFVEMSTPTMAYVHAGGGWTDVPGTELQVKINLLDKVGKYWFRKKP